MKVPLKLLWTLGYYFAGADSVVNEVSLQCQMVEQVETSIRIGSKECTG